MPLMFSEEPQKAANVQLGDVEISTTAPTSGAKKSERLELRTTSLSLPAGAYRIQVIHIDPTRGSSFRVNGRDLNYFNAQWQDDMAYDRVNDVQDFVGAVEIQNPDGVLFVIDVDYPSSSPFDPSTLQ